jgi:hypothetical protein
VIWLVTAGLAAYTAQQDLRRYREFRTGWSWDLAYYNQWCWAITRGDGKITVRPFAHYGDEGPSVWHMNYLSPIRFLVLPFYALRPDPTTLLLVQAIGFWLCIPAAFSLARSEWRSDAFALSAAALVPITPLIGPLAVNDFRELQLAIPFVLWTIEGVRSRRAGVAALGIAGMLACRQEFALVVAMLGVVPARAPEDIGQTYRWFWVTFFLGIAWMLWAFFGFLYWSGNHYGPTLYLNEFRGAGATLAQTANTAAEFLSIGLGAWAVLAMFAPRVAILALPWLWSLSHGKWALGFIGTTEWHHVRYTAPLAALGIGAGIVGYASVARRLNVLPRAPIALVLLWAAALGGMLAGKATVDRWWAQAPRPISPAEAAAIWRWIGEVRRGDAVVAAYEVTAPLSNRRELFSYRMDRNKPRGYPDALPPQFRWVFIERGRLAPEVLLQQGFERVYNGNFLMVFRRE